MVIAIGAIAGTATNAVQASELAEDAYREFGQRLTLAVEKGDLEECGRLFDTRSYVEGFFKGVAFHYRDGQAAEAKWVLRFEREHGVYASTVADASLGGSYRLLRSLPGEEPRLLVRLVCGDGTLDYHTLTLSTSHTGELRVVRTTSMRRGGDFFAQIRHVLSRYMAHETDDSLISDRAPEAAAMRLEKRLLSGIQTAARQKKHRDALYFFQQLPRSVQNGRHVLLTTIDNSIAYERELAAAERSRHKSWTTRLLDRYEDIYPNDLAATLRCVDYASYHKDFEQARRCVAVINKAVGGDPYLDLVAAIVESRSGNHGLAIALAELASEKLPEIATVHTEVASIHAAAGDNVSAVARLNALYDGFRLTIEEDAVDGTRWGRLFDSSEYRSWKDNL
ncbi:MAG: hypothetical protein AAFV43_02735 [Planctomycetota bacterium]